MVVQAAGDLAIGALTTAMGALTNQLKSSMDFAMKAEKASLALGMTFEQTNSEFSSQMGQLRGSLTERFAASIAGMEAGLQGNTAGLGRLINQQRLTGTQSAKTAGVFAKMEMTLGNSREATNALADSLPELGRKWQIGTDVLVNSIDNLSESMPAMKLAGMGTDVMKAIEELQGEVGTSMGDTLNSVMKTIFDTGDQAFQSLATLGIGTLREQLTATKGVAPIVEVFKKAIFTAGNRVKDFTAGAPDLFLVAGQADKAFGTVGMKMMTIMDALGRRVEVMDESALEFGDQLKIIKDEVFVPLHTAFAAAFPTIKKVAILLGAHLKNAVSSLVDSSIRLYLKFEAFSSIVGFTIDVLVSSFKTISLIAGIMLAIANPLLGLAVLLGYGAYKTSDLSKDNAIVDKMNSEELLEAFKKKMDDDAEALGISLETAANTKKTADLLEDRDDNTAPDFLSQSANILGRGIEAQLGMTDNQTLVDVIAELQVANEFAAAQLANSEERIISAPVTNSK